MHETVIVNPKIASALLPSRPDTGHKGTFGTLLSVCGSRDMPGAACLSAMAALRCGVGLVMMASVPSVISVAQSRMLEPIYIPLAEDAGGHISSVNADRLLSLPRPTVILAGCGIGVSEDTRSLMHSLSKNSPLPMVIDADGLNSVKENIASLKSRKAGTVLTPHLGELAGLIGKDRAAVINDPYGSAGILQEISGAVVVAKSSTTNIVSDKAHHLLDAPNSGLAKGGSGDVLAGCIASFLAQGLSAEDAAVLGVYVHSAAGKRAADRLGRYGMLPSDIINEIPYILKELEEIRDEDTRP